MDKEERGEWSRRVDDTPVKSRDGPQPDRKPQNVATQCKSLPPGDEEPALSLSLSVFPISHVARRLMHGLPRPGREGESLRKVIAEPHKNEELTRSHNGLFKESLFNNCLSLKILCVLPRNNGPILALFSL